MIEGLRVAPAYLDARHEGLVPKSCDECKRTTPMVNRQHMRCGYEKPLGGPGAQSWAPPFMETTVCPGYSTSLPSVAELLHVYPHWEAGTLGDYLGARPIAPALDGLVALKAGINEHQADQMRRRQKGGG